MMEGGGRREQSDCTERLYFLWRPRTGIDLVHHTCSRSHLSSNQFVSRRVLAMETVLCSFSAFCIALSVLMRSFKCHNVLHVESMLFLVFVFACLLLHLSNTFPNAIFFLASLLLSCVAANGRIRSFRLQMLLVTSGLLLGPAFSGILCLVLWPSLFIALGFACWLLRFVVVRATSTVEYLTDTKTSTSHVARATSASKKLDSACKKLERRAQKKAARQRRALIFAFGSSFLRWFERMLCLWLPTIQLFFCL